MQIRHRRTLKYQFYFSSPNRELTVSDCSSRTEIITILKCQHFFYRFFNYRFDSCLGKKIDPRFMIQCLSLWFFFLLLFFRNIIIVIDDFWSPWVRPKTCCLLIVGDILHPSHLSPPDLCVGLRNDRFIATTKLFWTARRWGRFAATTRRDNLSLRYDSDVSKCFVHYLCSVEACCGIVLE